MATNVFCDLCEKEVGQDDSFVVESGACIMALHYECGREIQTAMTISLKRDQARGHSGETKVNVVATMHDLLPLEARIQRLESVWKLWLNEAERGSISQSTFGAMKTLLGM